MHFCVVYDLSVTSIVNVSNKYWTNYFYPFLFYSKITAGQMKTCLFPFGQYSLDENSLWRITQNTSGAAELEMHYANPITTVSPRAAKRELTRTALLIPEPKNLIKNYAATKRIHQSKFLSLWRKVHFWTRRFLSLNRLWNHKGHSSDILNLNFMKILSNPLV